MSSRSIRAGERHPILRFAVFVALLVVASAAAHARSALKPGEYIFTSAAVGADGTMTIQRIQVSRDGVKPPQQETRQ
jgi:hypothetical protein